MYLINILINYSAFDIFSRLTLSEHGENVKAVCSFLLFFLWTIRNVFVSVNLCTKQTPVTKSQSCGQTAEKQILPSSAAIIWPATPQCLYLHC